MVVVNQQFKMQGSTDIIPDQVILHSLANAWNFTAGLGWLRSASNPLESHYAIRRDGYIVQLVAERERAEANYRANKRANGHGAISIETDSDKDGNEPWTAEQCAAIIDLVADICRRHNIPARLCPAWDQPGIGWHVMFGSPGQWTPVAKVCPGPKRIEQMKTVIVPGVQAALAPAPAAPAPAPVPGPTPAPAPEYPGLLKRGSKGDAVKTLQRRLNAHRTTSGLGVITVDGDFGPGTERTVRWYQECRHGAPFHLAVDGLVGPATWRSLWQ
jgi:hypothetical protein